MTPKMAYWAGGKDGCGGAGNERPTAVGQILAGAVVLDHPATSGWRHRPIIVPARGLGNSAVTCIAHVMVRPAIIL